MRLPAPAQQLAIRIALVLLACSLAGWVEWQRPQLLARFDETLRDLLHQVSAKHEPESRVAVIDIDEASLQAMGPWPWPRQRMADLLEILLTTYRVRAIGVDILFPEPADPAGDARLAMLAEHAPVTLAQIFDYVPHRTPPSPVAARRWHLPRTWPAPPPAGASSPSKSANSSRWRKAGVA